MPDRGPDHSGGGGGGERETGSAASQSAVGVLNGLPDGCGGAVLEQADHRYREDGDGAQERGQRVAWAARVQGAAHFLGHAGPGRCGSTAVWWRVLRGRVLGGLGGAASQPRSGRVTTTHGSQPGERTGKVWWSCAAGGVGADQPVKACSRVGWQAISVDAEELQDRWLGAGDAQPALAGERLMTGTLCPPYRPCPGSSRGPSPAISSSGKPARTRRSGLPRHHAPHGVGAGARARAHQMERLTGDGARWRHRPLCHGHICGFKGTRAGRERPDAPDAGPGRWNFAPTGWATAVGASQIGPGAGCAAGQGRPHVPGGAVLFEVLEDSGSPRHLAGERDDRGVLGGPRLQIADPALQPGTGGTGEDEQHAGEDRIPAQPAGLRGGGPAPADGLGLVLIRAAGRTRSASPPGAHRSWWRGRPPRMRAACAAAPPDDGAVHDGVGHRSLPFAEGVRHLGRPVPGPCSCPSRRASAAKTGWARTTVRGCAVFSDAAVVEVIGAGRPPPQDRQVPRQARAVGVRYQAWVGERSEPGSTV
ncbi:hypothetical protein SUDANB126_07302 [Streptomyces sp. enrichment culture]